jgi:GNAT acetyltransferase-like protein
VNADDGQGSPRVYETALGPVSIAAFEERDLPSCLDLFRVVFGREKSEAEFRWQFLDNPVGVHFEVGRDEAGKVVSQFCAIPARVKIRDREFTFGQIIDTVVHPDHRQGLKRKGLYSATVDSFVERWGHRDRELVMMGLPNEPAFRIGRLMAGYVPMGRVYFQSKSIEPRPGVPELPQVVERRGRRFRIAAVDRFGADVDQLHARLRERHDAVCVRDAATLNWRYADGPDPQRYVRLELRDEESHELYGVAAGRIAYLEAPDGVLADWFVDREIPGAREVFLRVIEELMAAVSMTRVQILLNPTHEESRFFEDAGYRLAPTHYRMVSRTYDSDIVTPEWLARNWHYLLGDFDVI